MYFIFSDIPLSASLTSVGILPIRNYFVFQCVFLYLSVLPNIHFVCLYEGIQLSRLCLIVFILLHTIVSKIFDVQFIFHLHIQYIIFS
jgi:hypothetical protein